MIGGIVGYGAGVFKKNNYSLKQWYNTYLSKYSHYTFDVGRDTDVTAADSLTGNTDAASENGASTAADESAVQ